MSPTELVCMAQKFGLKELVLTDINNTSCSIEFINACKKAGIKPILGIEFRKENEFLYIGIAKNREGWRQLNSFYSMHQLDGKPLPSVAPDMPDTYIIYPRLIKPMKLFGKNEFLGIRPQHVNRIYNSKIKNHIDKLVVLNPVVFKDADDLITHKLMRCIDLNIVAGKLVKKDYANESAFMIDPNSLKQTYKIYSKIIENTEMILSNCSIDLEVGHQINRRTFTGSKDGDFELLQKLAMDGCRKRYGMSNRKAIQRIEKELIVIRKQDFSAYFLITWDIIRYAQSCGFHHVGRGSGANSIVAFCLEITDVDPLELDLYFERFINPHRTSPPDFDIDFSWDERDVVTDYIFKRYGKKHTALLATYSTFKDKSIIRELGKVLGLPKSEVDLIIKYPRDIEKHHALSKTIFKYSKRIEGFPNYLSIHAGGVLISENEIFEHTALLMMPKGFPVTHFDMYHAENMGYHKFDMLSQRGLGHIKSTVDLVKKNQGKAIDIHDVAAIKNDKRVKAQLYSGQAIGCFYIESPAMRGLLSKLKCDNYISLVAASSIIRPGVAKSGMMREYIKRFHDPNSFKYIHPIFKKHLGETYGVMVYQEDVMKIVHHFADLDLDESDVLRRIMSGKKYRSDTFEYLRNKYFSNCKKRGHSDELAMEVWRQIESFAGYSFSKAHSASYAVESFQSLFLKTYFPLEFMVAVINNFGGFYQTEYYFHEARMQGANIHAPCVNHSQYLTTIYKTDIYVGLIHLHSLERNTAYRIVKERKKEGPFLSMENFVNRVKITTDQIDILIRIGAFRFTEMNKYELMWEKNAVFNPKVQYESTATLFEDAVERYELPTLEESPYDQAFDEIELLGFSIQTPFFLLGKPPQKHLITARLFELNEGRYIEILGYYVTRKNVRTSNHKLMFFGTWIDTNGKYFDTVHFPNSIITYPFKGKGIYRIKGKVVTDFGFLSLEVVEMEKLPYVRDGRY